MQRDQFDIAAADDLAGARPADDAAADHIAPNATPAVDWSRVIADAGLDADSIAYLSARELRGIPHSQIPSALGWYAARGERVRKRIQRAIARLRVTGVPAAPAPRGGDADDRPLDRGSSLRPFYLEQLDSGRRLYALSRSNHLLRPELPISRRPLSRGVLTMSSREKLKIESGKLARIGERVHQARVASDDASGELSKAQSAITAEAAAAVLEDRVAQTAQLQKRAAALQTALDERRAELAGAEAAHRQQAANVESIQAEIVATQHATFLTATLAGRKRIRELIENLSLEMESYQTVAFQHGQDGYVQNHDLFPFDPADPLSSASYRQSMLNTANSALSIAQHRWQKASMSAIHA